ncbi:MAG: flagellar hook assembly protein FlgD [Parvularculaceae bacterium]
MDIAALAASTQAAASTSAFSSLTQNFDTFLKLLTTQLKNQDPLDPLDTEKFTEQLVQFSSVEQAIKTNAHLEALIALQGAAERQSALGFVGRDVTLATDRAMNSGDGAQWNYALPNAAASVSLTIVDANGAVVARRAGSINAGANTVAWDGLADNGEKAAPGLYRLIVDARGADGAPIFAEITSEARVSAVAFNAQNTLLETPIGLVSLDAVRRVVAGS